jgi:hypothetical protein
MAWMERPASATPRFNREAANMGGMVIPALDAGQETPESHVYRGMWSNNSYDPGRARMSIPGYLAINMQSLRD